MNGLFYKELYMGRRSYLAFLALALVFAVLGMLVFLSMVCGNLRFLPEEDPGQVCFMAEVFTYVPFTLMLFAAGGSCQSVYCDYACGWMRYSYTLPLKPEKAVGMRYLAVLLILAASFVFGSVSAAAVRALAGYVLGGRKSIGIFGAAVFENMLLLLLVAVVLYAFLIPLALRYQNARAVSARLVAAGLVLYLLCAAAVFLNMERLESLSGGEDEVLWQMILEKYRMLRSFMVPAAPLVLAAVLGISFYFSMRIYQRREHSVRSSL